MRFAKQLAALLLGAVLTIGCANVKVRKVDVDKRIEGRDHHIRGFRYYLNRPYIVVSATVPVSTKYDPVRQVSAVDSNKKPFYGLQSIVPTDPNIQPTIYDLSGNVMPGAKILRLGDPAATVPTASGTTPKKAATAESKRPPRHPRRRRFPRQRPTTAAGFVKGPSRQAQE